MKQKLIFLTMALLFTTVLFAQADPEPTISFVEYVASFAALVGVIPIVTEFLKIKLKISGLGLQVTSWVVGVVIALLAYFFKLGIFEGVLLWHALIIGVGASLVANGVADTGIVKGIFGLLGLTVKRPAN